MDRENVRKGGSDGRNPPVLASRETPHVSSCSASPSRRAGCGGGARSGAERP